MNPQIKHRYTGAVLFEGEAGMTTRAMLEKATTAKADLYGADLYGANLRYTDLRGANLYGANLYGANLGETFGKLIAGRPFFQCGPIGSRSDYLQSFITDKGIVIKAGCFTGFLDEFVVAVEKTHGDSDHGKEYVIKDGCFTGFLDAFVAAVEKTHGDSDHGKEYAMAVLMIEAHAAIWGEKQ